MSCSHHRPKLSPATVQELGEEFDAEILSVLRHDVEQLAAADTPAAGALRILAQALREAWEEAAYREQPR